MPRRTSTPAVSVAVTPRFEIFYALQALESGSGERFRNWRRSVERRLSSRSRGIVASVAPSPLMWPLLADALCDEPAGLSFEQIVSVLRRAEPRAFQRAVVGGVFKQREAVEALISGDLTLERAIAGEGAHRRLLELLGLHPFDATSAPAEAFERLVSRPDEYRNAVLNALEIFWEAGFNETWEILEPQMRESARRLRASLTRDGFRSVAAAWKIPVSFERPVRDIHLIPSVFNVSRLWANYIDSDKRARIFIPVLDADLSLDDSQEATESVQTRAITVEPARVFRALGDTTRYAIATTLARTPMTSVELSRTFKVSKPTISHHVQQLREAHLLIERQSDKGVVLSLDRRTLERTSSAAAAEMFSAAGPDHVIRRSRRKNKS